MSKFIRRLSLVTVLLMAICPFFVNANAIDGEIINPIYGVVDYTARSQATGHALVIRGYYTYTNSSSYAGSISYMDPDSASYAASNVAKSGSRPYVYTYAETGAEVAKITNFLAISE